MEIHGFCDDAFAGVRDAFVGNFDAGNELGASVAVTHHGKPVVDLWAGDADEHGRPWREDTIVNVYSTTKTMTFTCVLMLADRGLVDFDAPVATYWPEFAANGKEGVLLRHVMSHNAGLSGFDPAITATDLYDWDGICTGLAAQAPWWEPGTGSGYHLVTQGYLLGEVVRRVTGMSVGTFFRDRGRRAARRRLPHRASRVRGRTGSPTWSRPTSSRWRPASRPPRPRSPRARC